MLKGLLRTMLEKSLPRCSRNRYDKRQEIYLFSLLHIFLNRRQGAVVIIVRDFLQDHLATIPSRFRRSSCDAKTGNKVNGTQLRMAIIYIRKDAP